MDDGLKPAVVICQCINPFVCQCFKAQKDFGSRENVKEFTIIPSSGVVPSNELTKIEVTNITQIISKTDHA